MIETFTPCMRVDVEPSSSWSCDARVVTMRHKPTRWAQHPLPRSATNHHLPFSPLASAAATLSNQSVVPVGAAVGGSFKVEGTHRALSSSSNYGEQRPCTSLGYDVGPHQNGSFPRPCGQQDMATRRCVDSVWVCYPRIAAAVATTPTPYRCRLHHQLLPLCHSFRVPGQSFVSSASPFVSPSSYILFTGCSTGHPFA